MIPHKLWARPKSDPNAKPFEITVSQNVGDEAAARAHIAAHCSTLELVETPAELPPTSPVQLNQPIGADGVAAGNVPPSEASGEDAH